MYLVFKRPAYTDVHSLSMLLLLLSMMLRRWGVLLPAGGQVPDHDHVPHCSHHLHCSGGLSLPGSAQHPGPAAPAVQ